MAAINYRGGKRERAASKRQRLPDKVQLFICLFFLRQYPTYATLSFAMGGLSRLSLHHYIFRVLTALAGLEELAIRWPTDEEMAELVKKPKNWPYPEFANVVASMDGTEIRAQRPTDNAIKNPHYSAKKKQYALNVLLVVLLSGIIIYCSSPQPRMNDQGFFNDTKIRARFVGKPWGLIADGGFTLNAKEAVAKEGRIIGHTPHKRQRRARKESSKAPATPKTSSSAPLVDLDADTEVLCEGTVPILAAASPTKASPTGRKRSGLTDEQKEFNVKLSRMRVVVENTNARLKIYKIIGSKLRHYSPGKDNTEGPGICPSLVMKVVAGLTNRHIKEHPCRSPDWLPKAVTQADMMSAAGSDNEAECLEGDCDDE